MRVLVLVLVAGLGTALAVPTVVAPARREAAAADTAVLSRSIAYFETRFEADPWNYPVGNRLIERYLLRFHARGELADVQRAEMLARALAGIVRDRAGGLARLGAVLLMQHEFEEALESAEQARAMDPASPSALAVLFDAAMAVGRYAVAESALAALPHGSLGREVRRSQWLQARGHTEGAWPALDRVCRRLQRSSTRPTVVAWCLTELARIQHGRRSERAAKSLWRQALAAQPGYRGALEGLADLAHARGRWKEARDLYGRIATDAHADLYLRLAEVQQALGDTAEAARSEERVLRRARAPGAESLYGRALALYYADRGVSQDTALAIALRDVARRPAVESYDALSWVRFRRGELAEALEASERARAWGSPSPTMDYHRACILEALGRTQEAGALLTAALERPSLLEPHARLDLAERLGARAGSEW
jgi:tetratricopeptide (TPR) repeat protein